MSRQDYVDLSELWRQEHAYLCTWMLLQDSPLGFDFSMKRVQLARWLVDERKKVVQKIYRTAGFSEAQQPVCIVCHEPHCL